MTVGVLAVQGAFIEHEHRLEKLGVKCVEISQKEDLNDIDGIILPGWREHCSGTITAQA